MSLFAVQRLIFDLKHDKGRAALLKSDPQAALRDADLTDAERSALAHGDLASLYLMGVHPLLLAPYSRMVGISRADYQHALAPLKGARTFCSDYRLDSRGEA
ncbi:hypothetical protein [Pigmentiphaga sp. CHJ604]|uniref:hypothetical protein n=1 Tax=Pigmentiphaga sp. CHJ604 TaxID=3081984 RepID=UPI0030CEB36F